MVLLLPGSRGAILVVPEGVDEDPDFGMDIECGDERPGCRGLIN